MAMNVNYRNEIENSFAANFWGKGDKGLEVLLNHMRRTKEASDSLNKVLKGRAEIEENYGRQLVELSKNLINQDEIISMRDSMETLRLEIEATGQSRIDLALDVKEQITVLLNEFSTNQEKIINNYKTVMERHLHLKNQHTQEVVIVNEKYQKKCETALSLSNKLNTCKNEEEANYYKKLLRQTLIEAKELDKEYIMAINRLHQVYRKWQQEWTRKCENFQKFEEERIRFLFDQMWNYANMFSTVCVADDEGCEKLRVQLEKCDGKRDITYYIKEHKTGSVISEAPKYINYYSNVQFLEDVVDLSGETPFVIPHTARSDSKGRLPQQYQQPIRQSSFQYSNANMGMNNQQPVNQNFINKNGPMTQNQNIQPQQIQQPQQLQQLQQPPQQHMNMQNHQNGYVPVTQHQAIDSQKAIETEEENKNKMKKQSTHSLKKKLSKKLYVTNMSPRVSDTESDREEKEKRPPKPTKSKLRNEKDISEKTNSNNSNTDDAVIPPSTIVNNTDTTAKTTITTTNNNNVDGNKNENENNTDGNNEPEVDPNSSNISIVPQIPAVEEEENEKITNLNNINNLMLDESTIDYSLLKTPIPNAEQQPFHALPPAPVMMDTSVIIPPSALIKNESEMDEDKTSLSNNVESIETENEKIYNEINYDSKKSSPESNTENTMIPENEIIDETKEEKITVPTEPQIIPEIIVNNDSNSSDAKLEKDNEQEIVTINEKVDLIEEDKPLKADIKEVYDEEEEIKDEALTAEIRDAEEMEEKYDESEQLKAKVQDINESIKSSVFNNLEKPVPTFKELGFRDSYDNYSNVTDDVESVKIIEESSMEIVDNDNASYNRDSYNSQSYENNLVVIDDSEVNNTPVSTHTDILDDENIRGIETENYEDGAEADVEDNYRNQYVPSSQMSQYSHHSQFSQSSQPPLYEQHHQHQHQDYYNNNSSNNVNLNPEMEILDQELSTMTIDPTLVPQRNTSNEIAKEVEDRRNQIKKASYASLKSYSSSDDQQQDKLQKRRSQKKEGQTVTRMERRESLYGMKSNPGNPKRVTSFKNANKKPTESNVAEAAITAINNKMMGNTQVQDYQQKQPLNYNYSMGQQQSQPQQPQQPQSQLQSQPQSQQPPQLQQLQQLQIQPPQNPQQILKDNINNINPDSPTMLYGLHFIPPMLRNQLVQGQSIDNQNYNNRFSSGSNLSSKYNENTIESPASNYSNGKNQQYQYNMINSPINNGVNGSAYSVPIEQQQQQQQQASQQMTIQLMPEYQGQPTTPSQQYIEINNIPKSPAVELNSTYNPYDLSIKKPVLFSVKTLYDYEAVSFEEVSFKSNVVLPILAVQEDGWWETEVSEYSPNGSIIRRRGLIPSNFVEVINE